MFFSKLLTNAIIAAVFFLFVGCSQDSITILDHPDQVAASSQFDVVLLNQFVLVDNGATATQDVNRDSLHVAIGLPDGFSVVAAKCYFANALNIVKLSTTVDSITGDKLLKDSSVIYKSRATNMQTATSFIDIFRHRVYEAKNVNDTMPITINTDSVKNWSLWSGKVNMAIPVGTKADTTIDTMGMSLGVTTKPIFIWLTLKAKNTTGQDTILYFTKTAAMPLLSDTSSSDLGEMKYVPITVSTSGVRSLSSVKKENAILSIISNPAGNNIVIDFRGVCKDASALDIYSVSGKKVADLSSGIAGSNGLLSWNAKNSNAKPGLYIVRLKTRNGNMSTSLRVF